ncbi:MAG: IS1 family transposase [Nitrospirae bacterium]|nr:IS1 family transposase [Nitrospirota bacterium]
MQAYVVNRSLDACNKFTSCDEIWSFCYSKDKKVPEEFEGEFGYGDIWTWTALCADTKLIASWLVGDRSATTAKLFINDLASRLSSRIQRTTDGYKIYIDAVERAFGMDIDYAMPVKIYSDDAMKEKRYSPVVCTGAEKRIIQGKPDLKYTSTSYTERQNLTMRMSMRRFTRLTNAFSKKVENHCHAIALYFMYYNFARIHKTLRVTPAMEASISNHVWAIEEILSLMP